MLPFTTLVTPLLSLENQKCRVWGYKVLKLESRAQTHLTHLGNSVIHGTHEAELKEITTHNIIHCFWRKQCSVSGKKKQKVKEAIFTLSNASH